MRFFVTSTGTGVGKTFITAGLARQAREHRRSVMAYKPIITGITLQKRTNGMPACAGMTREETSNDTTILLDAMGLPVTPENIERVSPWRYAMPLAPSMAARLENRPLDFHALVAHSQKAVNGNEDIVLIEGVGGVMAPLNDRRTVLDWMEALGIPVLLVVGSYLGSISHTLTALSALRQRHVPVHALVVNESAPRPVSPQDTADELRLWTQLPLFEVKRGATMLPNLLGLA